MEFLSKLKVELPFDLTIPLLVVYPKNPETSIQKDLCTPMFIAAQFTIAKCWKQPKCPSVNEWIKNYGTFTQQNTTAEGKKELLPFTRAQVELESIMLSEISQAVKDKYHMISSINGTQSTKQTSKNNRTRDFEMKKKLTVTREERGEG